MWQTGRNLVRPIRSKTSLCPFVKDGPTNMCLLNICFSSYMWITYLPFKVSNQCHLFLLISRWHISPNGPNCPWEPHCLMESPHILCNYTWSFSPVALSHVNLIIRTARRGKSGKIFPLSQNTVHLDLIKIKLIHKIKDLSSSWVGLVL